MADLGILKVRTESINVGGEIVSGKPEGRASVATVRQQYKMMSAFGWFPRAWIKQLAMFSLMPGT